jgi:hypothetical protein
MEESFACYFQSDAKRMPLAEATNAKDLLGDSATLR